MGHITNLLIDIITRALAVIDVAHQQVHKGNHYTVSDYDESVAVAAPKRWLIVTPDSDARIHLKIAAVGSGPALTEFFRDPTVTEDGTPITAFNNDDNSLNETTASFFADPTVTLDGTRMDFAYIGTYNPRIQIGGDTRDQAEIILRKNMKYQLKVTVEGADTKVSALLEFYEV